ncbi:MAG TPA: AsmA-like C-terminal region-containing protein, partial [Burkholderiales bacterium]|nr:AsmA-like C-terminal region-containing protein [Burkholderiales bacterium]
TDAVDPFDAYRSAVEAIRAFAPEAEVDVEDADLDIRIAGMPPLRVRRLEAHASTASKGLKLDLSAAGESWSRLKLSASVDFADLSGAAQLDVAELKAQPWLDRLLDGLPVGVALPSASVRAGARTDGKSKLDGDVDLRAGSVEILRAAERVQLPDVALAGKVGVTGKEISLQLSSARLGAVRLAGGSFRYSLKDGYTSGVSQFDLDLAQVMDSARRLLPENARAALARLPITGRAQGRATFNLEDSSWGALIEVRESDSSIGIEGLPGPVRLASGSANVNADAVKIDRAVLSMLDSRAVASATVDYGGALRIEGAASQGSVGENTIDWIWKTAGLPPRLVLKAPVRLEVQRAAWSPGKPLALAASASFDRGPNVAVDLGWTPDTLDLRRATIKDASSNATIALRVKSTAFEGNFSGALQSATLAAALRDVKLPSGGASGELGFRFDLQKPERFSVTGKLKAEAIDLAWLLGRPVTVEHIDADADGQKLRVRRAEVNWADQRLALRGELARAADGAPVIDAQIESPGVLVDALLKRVGEKPTAPSEEKAKPAKSDEALWTHWPLPVRGRIAVRTEFIQYGERKAAPVAAVLVLEEQRASLEIQDVRLCGISLPLTAEATSKGVAIAARITAQKQQLEGTARCLTEQGLQISGEFDLSADLRTQGRLHQLLPNLEGTVSAEARQGRVMKFALLGNILSMKGVTDLLKEGAPKADGAGFPYRSLSAKGRFAGGKFTIEQSGFDSSAFGLAANGWISLIDYDSKLTVLVAPFARVDRLARSVPILG